MSDNKPAIGSSAISLRQIINDKSKTDAIMCSSHYMWNIDGLDPESFTGLPVKFRQIHVGNAKFSASGIFTGPQLKRAFSSIRSENSWVKTIHVLDAMKEDHGLVVVHMDNKEPIEVPFTFRGSNNSANSHIPHDKVEEREAYIVSQINEKLRGKVAVASSYTTMQGSVDEVHQVVEMQGYCITERELCESMYNVSYQRVACVDHRPPTYESIIDVARFTYYKFNPKTDWVHIHCHGGNGRSTSISVILDMLLRSKDGNLSKTSFSEIIKEHKYQGDRDLSLITHKEWKQQFARDRYDLLDKIYNLLFKVEKLGIQDFTVTALKLCMIEDHPDRATVYNLMQEDLNHSKHQFSVVRQEGIVTHLLDLHSEFNQYFHEHRADYNLQYDDSFSDADTPQEHMSINEYL